MARCLVLGGNGFIGSHLVDALVDAGHNVRAFDKFSKDTVYEAKDVEVFAGDFLNRNDLTNALNGTEYVFHFISTTTPLTAENDPLIDVETNIRMSIELMQECVNAGVKRLLFASTGGAIYGSGHEDSLKESDMPQPVSPYAIGKLTIEHYMRYFTVKHGLDSISYRISNPYGERQPLRRKQGVIPIFLERLYNNQQLTILGDGSMVRDYVYVKDVATCIATTFDKDHTSNVYNIGTGTGVSVSELVTAVEKTTNKTADKQYVDKPDTFVQKIILDTKQFAVEYGISPTTSLADGIEATWQYIVNEHKSVE
ncbi:MAG: NAD-dependent epimerase/dehydratase family protein [bacterium]